jgi:ATP/ADP translocase/HEAT repeat protein
MRTGRFWLRLFNVYPSEWRIVKHLYLLQFFQGAGAAFFFTSVFAQFLQKFPVTQLSWVLILASGLLWISGFLYTRFEHVLPFKQFNVWVIVMMALSILLLRIGGYYIKEDWYYYLLLAWFNVLYLLNNLEFWGIAASHFDLRQSKRLFAVISAGDIPAKFIGYTLALIIVPLTGTQNLLYIGAGCMLASLFIFNSLAKSGMLKTHLAHAKHPHKKHGPKQLTKIVSEFTTNAFVRRIAFISLLTGTAIILINFGFYSEVRKAYEDDIALARFIAFFYAFLRITALITKMVFSSRVTANMGVRTALYITPVGMVILVTSILFANWMSPGERVIFYLFGVTSVVVEVLRTSFNSPVLLTLMQPLNTYERLRAHNIVKGIMDPFASLFSGLFILISINIQKQTNLVTICYVLLIIGVLWLLGVALVNRQYLHMLVNTISTRFFSQEEFDLNDEKIIQEIKEKMKTATDFEMISIMRMLMSKINPASEELISSLLHHPSEQVKLEAIRLIRSNNLVHAKERLEAILQEPISDQIRHEAIKVICALSTDEAESARLLEDSSEEVRKAAITGLLNNKHAPIREIGKAAVGRLLSFTLEKDRQSIIALLEEVKDEYDHPGHAYLISDPDPNTRDAAMRAIGKACSVETLNALWKNVRLNEKQVLASLYEAGSKAIPLIKTQLFSPSTSAALKEKLILLVGKIGGEKAEELLLNLLENQPQFTPFAIKALHRCKYNTRQDSHILLENIARRYILYGVELLYMQQALSETHSLESLLNNSIHNEIEEIRELLLCLFECMYDRKKINQVKYALNTKQREGIANAMEIIELTVKKDIGRNFTKMFETTNIEQRCIALRSLLTEKQSEKIEQLLTKVLSEKPIFYLDWTKACSLYISKKGVHPLHSSLFNKYLHSESALLKETALYASTNL